MGEIEGDRAEHTQCKSVGITLQPKHQKNGTDTHMAVTSHNFYDSSASKHGWQSYGYYDPQSVDTLLTHFNPFDRLQICPKKMYN